jgi:hypothetical protein
VSSNNVWSSFSLRLMNDDRRAGVRLELKSYANTHGAVGDDSRAV